MKNYIATIDGGEGGETIIAATDSTEALRLAIEWAKKGDWSENNNAHLGGVSVDVVYDEDDSNSGHFYPERNNAA